LEQEPKYRELFAIAQKLDGKIRCTSLHAVGLVIARTDITDYVPICRDSKTGQISTQFDMNVLEGCGLVKFDLLGLETLTLIRNTEELIRKRGGSYAEFSIDTIPLDDTATFNMLGKGNCRGVFQFESEGIQMVLEEAQPDCIEDLMALNAMYIPGPIDNIPQFIDAKLGRRPIFYMDPCVEDILKETYGVIVYQEQVMQIVNKVAGYSLGQADVLRRAMGKRKQEILMKEKATFIAGAVNRGFNEADAGRIFEILVPFASYAFNKSHAAAYALVSYQTAYLKANFQDEFNKVFIESDNDEKFD
jgi:DNA polymerase-3 subunit alpha